MRWPWSRRETRASYSDALTLALIRDAEGTDAPKAQPEATAAVEAAAGLYGRAFASAEVEGADALTASVLSCIGRDLIRYGESVHLIEIRRAGLVLVPVASFDVEGEYDPATWRYAVELVGPSQTVTRTRPGRAVIHCAWSRSPSRPWIGEGPLELAGLSSELLSSLETRLGQEAAAPSAYVIPSPVDGASQTTASLRTDLKAAKGGVVMAETMAGAYGKGMAEAPQSDWQQKRIGSEPPDVLRALRSDVGRHVAAACGIPADLIEAGTDAAGQREAYRRWLWASVVPLGRLVAEEASAKLDAAVSLTFDRLGAGDLQGRTRSVKQLVEAGWDRTEAARIAGLDG